jgi:hypothetical protein
MMRVEGNCFVGECECCGKETVLMKYLPVYAYSYFYVCSVCVYEFMEGER